MKKSLLGVLLMSAIAVLLLSTGTLAVGTTTITNYDKGTNTLTWGTVPDATSYEVRLYESSLPSGLWGTWTTLAGDVDAVLTGVQRGNGYYAFVITYNSVDSSSSISEPYYIDLLYPAAPSVVLDGLGTITGFQWTTPINPANPLVPMIANYVVEVTGANGLSYEETVPGTTTSLAFDPAAWWPTGNVYSSYRARVRAINAEGKESEWSEYSLEGTLPLPQIATYSYEILRLPSETGIATDSVINDREVLVRWDRLSSFPGTFINWDPDKVTWELEVFRYEIGSLPPSLPYYSAVLPNQESKVAHVVPIGEEGKYMRHSFFFRPFYDGEPLYTGTIYNGMLMRGFFVDLKGPAAVSMVDSPDNPSAYDASWVFDWNEAAETDPATDYELLIERLEGTTSAVDAEVRIPVTNAGLPLTVDPRDHFDRIYGQRFRYSVTPYDVLGNEGVAISGAFEVSSPSLGVTMATFTSTASTGTVTWDSVAGAASYELEVSSENGTHTWTGIAGNSQSFSWATVFPASNVYRTWHARVRAIDADGNIGAWSTDISYPLTMPTLSPLDFEILRVDTLTDAPANTRIADRQLLARWPVINSGNIPTDFINFDANRVTFDFQVDATSLNNSIVTSWLYTITANTWPCGQLVDVGVEGDEMTYIFYLQPLYDGVPMIGSWQFSSNYVIDLKGPSAVTITDYPDDPALYDDPWVFDWNAVADPDPADSYGLLIERLEGTTSSVDAAVELSVADASLPITIQPREHFDKLYGRRFRFTVTPYDGTGNAGVAVTSTFTLNAPALVATMATFTSTASTATVTWSGVTSAASYELEVSGENGTHTWTGIAGTSLSFDWGTVFPTCNVYKAWHARVRAVDQEGNVGAWSTDIAYSLPLPQITTYAYEILSAETELPIASLSTVTDRSALVRWEKLAAYPGPGTFINWDSDKVSWELTVRELEAGVTSIETYYTVLISNQPNPPMPISHVVPIGIDGKVMRYSFFFRPLYDGEPMYSGPAPAYAPLSMGNFWVDLKGPETVTALTIDTHDLDRPAYEWELSWVAGVETQVPLDPASEYSLVIQRLEQDGTVDAFVTLEGLTTDSLSIDPTDYFNKIFGRFKAIVIPYDAYGNAGVEASEVFTFDAPDISVTMSTFTSTASDATVTWSGVAEAASYELEVSSENGTHTWTGLTGSSQSFSWASVFPACNVYKTWHARVRAYDHDGNVGAWSSDVSYLFTLPQLAAPTFLVSNIVDGPFASGTRINEETILIAWFEALAGPVGFINWDPNKLSYILDINIDGLAWYNNEIVDGFLQGVSVPVGIAGRTNNYSITLQAMYEGAPFSPVSPAFIAVVDLQGPAAVTLGTDPSVLTSWVFSWTPIVEADPATRYDIRIDALEGTSSSVDASVTLTGVTSPLTVDPTLHFDKLYRRFRYTVIPYDALGNPGAVAVEEFSFDAPVLNPEIDGFDSTSVSWTLEEGAVSYDVDIRSENGHYAWYGLTTPPQAIDWEVLFPGANVYKTWLAKVRGVDRDGNIGAWSADYTFVFDMPQINPPAFLVSNLVDGLLASDARVNEKQLLIVWAETEEPAGFLNWNPDKLSYLLNVDIENVPWMSANVIDIPFSGYSVPVGIDGRTNNYYITLQALYEDLPLSPASSVFTVIIDLEGPIQVDLDDAVTERPSYNWDFSWTAALEDDPADSYDLVIERLEATDGTVDASVTFHQEDDELSIDPRQYFDFIFGTFRYTVIPYDALGNEGQPASKTLVFANPALAASMLTLNSAEMTWTPIAEAVSYDLELSSENGFHTWTGLTATSQAINWAALFPDCNVYKMWHARVRGVDHDGNVGPWSNDLTFDFPLPMLESYAGQVLHTDDQTLVADGEVTNVREVMARWNKLASFASYGSFINWDSDKVTWELRVREKVIFESATETYYTVIIPNNPALISHVIPVGVEGQHKRYTVFFRPLYEGVPMMTNLTQIGDFFVDLQGPLAPTLNDVITSRPVYSWTFGWAAADEYDPAVSYDLTIDRIEAVDGTVDASVTFHQTDLTETIDPTHYFDYIFRRFRYTLVAYDALGNASIPVVKEFEFPKPDLTTAINAFDETHVAWDAATEAVKYDVEIRSENGHFTWDGHLGLTQDIDWALLFPDCNVYKTWQARVRAYDRDGNVGDWYGFDGNEWREFIFPLPVQPALALSVLTKYAGPAPTDEWINERYLSARWPGYNGTSPTNFINWDIQKVTYELNVVRVPNIPQMMVELRDSDLTQDGYMLFLGDPGDTATYHVSVQAFYEGVPLSVLATYGPIVIDLRGPEKVWLDNVDTDRPLYNWTFEWLPVEELDPAVSFDLIIERLEADGETVDAAITFNQTDLTKSINPEDYFDYIFRRFRYTVIGYDRLGNASLPVTKTFEFPKPELIMGTVTLTDTLVSWAAVTEAVKYDIELKSDNGTYNWYDVTATSVGIDWEAMFPGSNVYQVWQARVKAYDRDGNYGLWSAWATYDKLLPDTNAMNLGVYRMSDFTAAPVDTLIREDKLIVQWSAIVMPEGFENWDPDLITYEFIGTAYEGQSVVDEWMQEIGNAQGLMSLMVDVGLEGRQISYTFRVRVYYDGELLNIGADSGNYIIDFKGPLAVELDEVETERPDYSWTFGWTPAEEDDPAVSYDFTIERLEADHTTVDASITLHLTETELVMDPEEYFDYIFGWFRYTVVAYDALGNASIPATSTFEFPKPELIMGTVTLTDTLVSWAAVTESVKYDIELRSDNGTYNWYDVTATSVGIDWEAMFPGSNVYQVWQARVKAYDRDGNYGLWSAWATYDKLLPAIAAIQPYVLRTADLSTAPVSTRINDDELLVRWTAVSMPAGFENWDSDLVTYELIGTADTSSTHNEFKQLVSNTADLAVKVDVGVEGATTQYNFKVVAFYDGELWSSGMITAGPYIIDLEGPIAPGHHGVMTTRPAYNWTFSWAKATEPDMAVSYDLVIERTEGEEGAVHEVISFSQTALTKSIDPRDYFDQIFGWFRYTLVAYDALGNASEPVSSSFEFIKPALAMGELSFTDTGVNWTAVDEAVKYEIELKSDNGTYNWYDVTATSVAINWATMFPGANVYQTWQARVKAYDHDGNYGAWSAWQTYNKPFPSVNEPAVNVYLGSDPDTHAPVSTAMKQDELFVWWQLMGAPAGFVNWNQELVTYELIVSSTNEFGVNSFKHYISNYELTGIRVNVGVLGAVTSYYFRVNTFYDGELLKEADTAAGPYIIDLKAPAAAGGLDEDISSALWRFWWTAPADADLGGYVYELQKYDAQNGKWAPAAASDSISAGTNETYVDPLMLYWSVFGQFRWRVRAFDTLGNMNEGTWAYFGYTLNDAVAPENMQYELLGEHNTLDMEEEYATATQVRFSWETPFEPVAGINMNMLFYKVELMVEEVGEGSEWITEATYLMPWTPGIMKAKFTVGESGLTKHYQGRVQAIYLSEASSDDYSEAFYIDLERPSEVVGGADYSSTMLEYPMWTFTWDDSAEDTVGIGGFLFILERLEGSTTHAIAMLDLPYIAEEEEEEPGDYDYDGIDYWFDEGTGRFVLDMDPFEFVESIDGIFRYTLIPYDNLENMGYPTEGMEFASEWSDGDDYGTYPFINLYDNWMGEIGDMGWVNNNTYATVSFDIYGLEGYELEFTLDGELLVEGVDYMLLDAPYGSYNSDMYYLVLLESVRDLMQGDHGSGDLEIYAYVEEEGLVVQFTVDLFEYVYENERTGFGFGRFRPAVDPGFDY